MQKIQRTEIISVEVEVPRGYDICPRCKGRAHMSKYDLGYKSFVHDATLAALEECYVCHGKGFVPEGQYGN